MLIARIARAAPAAAFLALLLLAEGVLCGLNGLPLELTTADVAVLCLHHTKCLDMLLNLRHALPLSLSVNSAMLRPALSILFDRPLYALSTF